MSESRVTSVYEHALQCVYYAIGNRGICIDEAKLDEGRKIVDAEIKRNLAIASNQWGCTVFAGAANAPDDEEEDDTEEDELDESEDCEAGGSSVNINSTRGKYALLNKLKELGYEVPKITRKNATGDYETKQGTSVLAIKRMLADNQFGYPGGDKALRSVLKARKLGKLKNNYLNAFLLRRGREAFFLSNYNCAGTTSGRRSSRKHSFGYGYNHQNFPSHDKTAYLFRRCLIARPGNILLFVDQIQAEDWPVSALAGNFQALKELRDGVDRHSKLASIIFNRRIPAKSDPDWDKALHDQDRYIGKKGRHASNYGMDAPRFSDVLAEEADISMNIATCKDILSIIDRYDPSVKGVYHKYVQDTLSKSRVLVTPEPFCRERQFISLRPNDTNSQEFKEAYAFVPQSTVGDNTGFAVLALHSAGHSDFIVQEGHDSLVEDIPDSLASIYNNLMYISDAFTRSIRFHNGIEIQIPIEAEIGFSFDERVKIKNFTQAGVREAHEELVEQNYHGKNDSREILA